MSNEKMRAEFEEWAVTEGANIDIGDSEYVDDITLGAWLGWQASRAALCVELPKIVNSEWACTSDECAAMRDAIRLCKRAIESTGVRTR